jgi:hypothetical protein
MENKMAKYGTVTYTGKSGKKYEFTAYSWDTEFKENYGAVYFITKRSPNNDGGNSHTRIYVGQTGDLSERFDDHHKANCFSSKGANCKCIYGESNKESRLAIERDLIEAYDPPCNG